MQGLHCLTVEERNDWKAMMQLYRHGRLEKFTVLQFLEGIECLKQTLIAKRPMFLGCRSRSPVSPPLGGAAARSTSVESPVRGFNTVAARNTGKGCLKQTLITKRPVFLGCRSRSPAAPAMADAAACSTRLESPVRAFNTVAARNTGKGNKKRCTGISNLCRCI
eukprot:s5695_g1.t1